MYGFDVTGGPDAVSPFEYAFGFSVLPDYAIPASLANIFPENYALWTAIADPGPRPTNPLITNWRVGEVAGSPPLPVPASLGVTIEEGQAYFVESVSTQIDPIGAIGAGGNEFVNHGMLWSPTGPVVVGTFTEFLNTGTIVAAGTVGGLSGVNLGSAIFTNEGHILVYATLSAVGVNLYDTPGGAINAGRIHAVSTTFAAFGVQLGATASPLFVNYGEVFAAGMGTVIGITVGAGATIYNYGSIIAHYGGDNPQIGMAHGSRGVFNDLLFPLQVYNAGLIEAQTAVSTGSAPLELVNDVTGVIRGNIVANAAIPDDEGGGFGNDTVINDGVIEGNVSLGDGQDLYDGLGLLTGTLNLGSGNDTAVGGSSNDVFLGGAGNDRLEGWGGNDTLDGGAGIDTLDGGDGDDTIFYDAADNAANVLGGAGTDLLVFTGSVAPASFDLAAHGFERAEGRQTDTGANAWATRTVSYDNLWRADFATVVNDNGSYSEIDYDQLNAFNWTTNFNEYDALGRRDVNVTVFDSGVTSAYDFDQASVFNWVSNWNQYNASNALDINETIFDDGATTSMDFDADNAFNWTSNWLQHDAGGLLDLNETVFDNGVTSSYDYDQADVFVWSSNWNQYAPGGALDINVTVFDDGTSNSNDFDQANAFTWTSNFNAYVVGGAIDYTITEFDNGERTVLDYDQANAFTWATIWQLYDSNGVLIGYQGVNDDGSLFGGP